MSEKEEVPEFEKMFTSYSMEDYWSVERNAHERARERLAYVKGKRVPYVVKMSVYAAEIDRGVEWLEDNFRESMIQADVIVFRDVKQKQAYQRNGVLVYMKHQ
jgi:hypothetical protein